MRRPLYFQPCFDWNGLCYAIALVLMRIHLLLLLAVTLAPASCAPTHVASTPRASAQRVYTADGHVLGVERSNPENPESYVHIVVAIDGKEPVRVELAPGWYLDEQGLRFSKEDAVWVEGQRTVREGKTVVVARRVRNGDETIMLRDDHGRPAWLK
jgi:hypothetical protein